MKRLIVWLGIFLCCGVAWAATTTTNYGLYKPTVGDTNWGTLVNNNFDTIDTQMKTTADAAALNTTHRTDNTQAHSDYLINNGDDTTSGTITASGFIGNVTGNVSGTSGSTTGNAGTATALAANGANCNAGNFPLGVDASGAVESCTDVWTEAENTSAGYAPLVSPSFTTPTLGVATATSVNKVTITAPATGSTLTIADGKTLTATNTVNLNTMTDGKWCKYTAAGTVLNCDQDAPAGTGDVSDVGNCTGGACLDGTSDGGTYIRLYEVATGFYGQISSSGLAGNTTYTLPQQNGTIITSGYLANSATLRSLLKDESGTGVALFVGGNIGAGTATTPPENDNDTSIATTAYVQTEISGIVAGDVNWDEMPLIMSAGVNWTDLEALAPINDDAINWNSMTDLASGGAVTWGNLAEGELANSTVISEDIKDGVIMSADVNWANIEVLAPINSAGVNWTDMVDLTTGGAVVWGNIAEGELADSTVVSGDIKDGTITAADTAITAGRSLTWSTNDIAADAELYTSTLAFVLETPADADAFLLWKAPQAITITDIDCIVGAATSAVIDIHECDSAGANCATVDATITCDTDGAADDGTFSNGAIDAGDWLKLDIGTVTGTVKYVSGTITYTKND